MLGGYKYAMVFVYPTTHGQTAYVSVCICRYCASPRATVKIDTDEAFCNGAVGGSFLGGNRRET